MNNYTKNSKQRRFDLGRLQHSQSRYMRKYSPQPLSLKTFFKNVLMITTLSLVGCQQPVDGKQSAEPIAIDTNQNGTDASKITNSTKNTTAVNLKSTDEQLTDSIIEQPITILALGDSLTEGLGLATDDAYPAQLQDALKDAGFINVKVINSGLSGETSSGLVNRLDWVLKTKPDITILTIGANDAMRGIDVAIIEKNIRTAIERLQKEGSIVILGGMQVYDNLGNEYVKNFSDIYPKLVREYDIAFIPFFLDGVGGVAALNQSDAIHPTAEGYTHIVNNNILPVLKPTIEEFVAHKEASADEARPNETVQ